MHQNGWNSVTPHLWCPTDAYVYIPLHHSPMQLIFLLIVPPYVKTKTIEDCSIKLYYANVQLAFYKCS